MTRSWAFPACCLLLYAAFFICLSLSRYYGLTSSLLDLGVFDQVFWSMLHHGAPLTSLNPPFMVRNWLGMHYSPILYALLPVYALFPSPETLLVSNVLLISSSAIPLYLTARHWQVSPMLATAWCAALLLNPFVLSADLWDFHEIAFAMPLMGTALYAVATRRLGLLLPALSLLLLCKEHFGLSVAGFGLLWLFLYKDRRNGIAIALLGLAACALIVLFIMPDIYGADTTNSQRVRYAWLLHPGALKEGFLFNMVCDAVIYGGTLLVSFWFLPLRAFLWLLPAAGDFAANILSANPMMRSFFSYHSATIVPVLAVAGLQAARQQASAYPKPSLAQLTGWIAAANIAFGLIAFMANIWEIDLRNLTAPHNADVSAIRALLPPGKSVSAQANIGSFFSQRPIMCVFPSEADSMDAVVLHVHFAYAHERDVFGTPLGMPTPEYVEAVKRLLSDKNWGIAYWHDDWLVLEKNTPGIAADRAEINEALKKMLNDYVGVVPTFLSPSAG